MPGWYWSIAITPPPVPASAATPAPQVAVSVDVAADFVLGKLAKRESGPWEVVLEPFEDTGHLPTSTGLEEAIRRRAAGMVPPVVVQGLSVGVKGFRPEGIVMAVRASL